MQIISNRTTTPSVEDYFAKREKLKNEIITILRLENPTISLRGSWHFNDFHLDISDLTSYSDLDLLLPHEIETPKLLTKIWNGIDNLLPLKISIHTEDHLSGISLADSKIKNIYEYLISYKNLSRKKNAIPDYLKAKTMLLLFKRIEGEQRFHAIKEEVGGKSMENLYSIKIGLERKINMPILSDLIEKESDELTRLFFENCIKSNPVESYFLTIKSQFLSTKTVDDWLKAYISSKLL